MAERSGVWSRVEEVLEGARVIAVLGAHVREHKPAFYVPDYMYRQGYRILPVNPSFAGKTAWAEPFRRLLGDLQDAVDVVNVFRRSELVPDHVEEILGMTPRPRWVWMQLGVMHDGAAEELARAGISVIQNRCMLADHQRWKDRREAASGLEQDG